MNTHSLKHGFTLVETLVAISILMLAILGPLTIASTGLRNSMYARDQITAYYLAQEGIEYARYVRDDNYINGADWLANLGHCVNQNGCTIDIPAWFDDGYGNYADGNQNKDMYINPDGEYTYVNFGTPSRYTRIITVGETIEDKEAKITSTVTWQTGSLSTKTFTLTENMFNIYKTLTL